MFDDEIEVGEVGPDDVIQEEPPDDFDIGSFKLPNQTRVSVELSEEAKQEIAFSFALGDRKVTNAIDILRRKNQTRYLIEEILPSNGILFLAGSSGTGKTILALQFVGEMIAGRPTMTYQIGESFKEKQIRVLVLSLEMNEDDLQLRFEHMYPKLSEQEEKLYAENYLVYAEPEPFELWKIEHIIELTRIIKACDPDMVLIDSASVSFANSMSDEETVRTSFKNLYKIRTRLDVAFMVVAHTRKPPQGILNNPDETTLNELMGTAAFGQQASGVLVMVEDEENRKATIKNSSSEEDEKIVWLINAKARFGANSGAFKTRLTSYIEVINRKKPLMFRRHAIPIEMTNEAKSKASKAPSEAILKDVLSQIDFGDDLDDGK